VVKGGLPEPLLASLVLKSPNFAAYSPSISQSRNKETLGGDVAWRKSSLKGEKMLLGVPLSIQSGNSVFFYAYGRIAVECWLLFCRGNNTINKTMKKSCGNSPFPYKLSLP
jgi:hypothetical protein